MTASLHLSLSYYTQLNSTPLDWKSFASQDCTAVQITSHLYTPRALLYIKTQEFAWLYSTCLSYTKHKWTAHHYTCTLLYCNSFTLLRSTLLLLRTSTQQNTLRALHYFTSLSP